MSDIQVIVVNDQGARDSGLSPEQIVRAVAPTQPRLPRRVKHKPGDSKQRPIPVKTLRALLIERGLDADPKPVKRVLRFLKGDRIIPGRAEEFDDIKCSIAGNGRSVYRRDAQVHRLLIEQSPNPVLEYVALFVQLNHLT